jgi:hypothetical protein
MTQQSCPCVQHSAPQHVSALEHVLAFWQGGVVHLPCSHVGAESGHTWPQLPQLKGSSSLSTQASPQQIWPSVHAFEHAPASPPPLPEPLPELLPEPLLDPLLDPDPLPEPLLEPLLPPLLEPPLDALPELLPLDPPEVPPDPLPLLPPEPPPLLLPLALSSTEASPAPAPPRVLVAPPQRAVTISNPARPSAHVKEARMTHLHR